MSVHAAYLETLTDEALTEQAVQSLVAPQQAEIRAELDRRGLPQPEVKPLPNADRTVTRISPEQARQRLASLLG
jgi:hypothetical protein